MTTESMTKLQPCRWKYLIIQALENSRDEKSLNWLWWAQRRLDQLEADGPSEELLDTKRRIRHCQELMEPIDAAIEWVRALPDPVD